MVDRIKIVLLLFVSSRFMSCNGQVKSESKLTETQYSEIGYTVSKMDKQIWEIFEDREGNLWFGSNGNGIFIYNGKTLKHITTNDGLIDNTIRGIQEDKEGNVYIETPEGVSKYDGTKFANLNIIKSAHDEWKLETTDLWFNCNGNLNHVYRFDGENIYELQLPKKDIQRVLDIHENDLSYSPYAVYGVHKDKKGNLWLGTVLAGAFRFDGESFLWIGEKELSRLPNGQEPGVRSILEDNDGNFWLSNFYSKYNIDPKLPRGYEKLKAVDLPKEIAGDKTLYFNSGLTADDGNLWMTTYDGGVWKYDGETLSNIEINNGNEGVLLISIYQDNSGTIWLGTNNDGVYKQNGDHFEKFEPKL